MTFRESGSSPDPEIVNPENELFRFFILEIQKWNIERLKLGLCGSWLQAKEGHGCADLEKTEKGKVIR